MYITKVSIIRKSFLSVPVSNVSLIIFKPFQLKWMKAKIPPEVKDLSYCQEDPIRNGINKSPCPIDSLPVGLNNETLLK